MKKSLCRKSAVLWALALSASASPVYAEKMDPNTGIITVDCETSDDRTCLECGYGGTGAQACCRTPAKCDVKNKVPPIVALTGKSPKATVATATTSPPKKVPGAVMVKPKPASDELRKKQAAKEADKEAAQKAEKDAAKEAAGKTDPPKSQ